MNWYSGGNTVTLILLGAGQYGMMAKEIAEEGDVVLLSPSTSSFDEFHSYVERGNVFKDIVNRL